MAHLMLFLSCLLILATLDEIQAVEYTVINMPGTAGQNKFDNAIGADYCRNTLMSASDFIWNTFGQNTQADRKDVERVTLIIDNYNGVAYANESNNDIHVGSNYIERYSGDVKREITGVLFHESTHIWQWNGAGNASGGLIEGIADYVRLKAGYAPSNWVGAGGGDRWDQGYDVTARFLDYCNSIKDGFVAELNGKMKTGYSNNFFVEILGKTVDQLWRDYKLKYGG